MAGSEFYEIPECGHVPQDEKPEETINIIKKFVRTHVIKKKKLAVASANEAGAARTDEAKDEKEGDDSSSDKPKRNKSRRKQSKTNIEKAEGTEAK
jgi:hypothetical protein